jgi:hypothetical protein
MTQSGPASAEATVTIAADPAAVYALITDLPTLAELAEETTAMSWQKGGSCTPGSVFKGQNSNAGRKWSTTCTVTDAEPARTFAFDVKSVVIPVAHWRYDIAAADGGCTVTERTWDKRPGWFKGIAGMATGVRDRDTANADHIRVTLERLKAKAEASA